MGATCTRLKAKIKASSQSRQKDRSDIYKVDETAVVVKTESSEEREAAKKELYQRVR